MVVNANDGGGGSDHYRTAFATHSAVSVLPVNGTLVFSLPLNQPSKLPKKYRYSFFSGW